MTSGLVWGLLAALVAGAGISVQAGINAELGRQLGHPLWATFVSFGTGFLILFPVLAFWGVPSPRLSSALSGGPWWIWTGGLIGVVFVTAALVLAPQLGVATMITAVIAGQLLASLVFDHFGLVGLPVHAVTWPRVAGMALIFAGAFVMQLQRTTP